jgi:DNA-binding NarL/FixJ family response regulator
VKNKNKIKIFLVDDDVVFIQLLKIEFLQHADLVIETHATGELCINHLYQDPDIIILDYCLNGINNTAMNGLETLDKIKAFNPDIPVVMLSGQNKIEIAINCIHHRALNYVVKKDSAFFRLQNIISSIFQFNKMHKQLNWYVDGGNKINSSEIN